ncbi:lipo-releasing system transmembrane protein lolC, partial [Vibrio parahaemolyticus V-223/04]
RLSAERLAWRCHSTSTPFWNRLAWLCSALAGIYQL